MDWLIIGKIFTDLFRIDRIDYPECGVLTFACDNDRSAIVRGKNYAPLINTVEDALARRGVECTSISRIASTLKGDLTHGRVFSPEGGFARAMVTKRLKQLVQGPALYPFSYAEKRIWGAILDQCKPRAVVGILPSRELCAACKERGIWVADIQHGVIAEAHPWYGASFRGSEPKNWAPDAFLVWDEGSAEVVRKWSGQSGAAIEVIGNPWVDRFRRKADDDLVYQEMLARYQLQKNGKPNVVVSLSWQVFDIPNGFIHPALERFILETLDTYNWRVRLHPNQLQGFASNEAPEFARYVERTYPRGALEWEITSAMPLPLLLSRTDYHVTWNSSVCLEAAAFGIRSLLMDAKLLPGNQWEEYYKFLSDLGYAQKIVPLYDNVKSWFDTHDGKLMAPLKDHSSHFEAIMDQIAVAAGR